MPPYNNNINNNTINSNNSSSGIPFSRSSSNPNNTNNNNLVTTTTIIPNRVSSFQKSIDEGRCPQMVMTETVSCGSSLTSQPQTSMMMSSSFATSHSQQQQQRNNNTKYYSTNGAATPSSPTSGSRKQYTTGNSSGSSYHQAQSVVSESSVIFQRSVGLSKQLAPPTSPILDGRQQQRNERKSMSPPDSYKKKAMTSSVSSTTSSPITSSRYANSSRRNRLLQRSSADLQHSPISTTTNVKSSAYSTSSTKEIVPSPPHSPVSSTATSEQRRNHHLRMLRQNRRSSSLQKQQENPTSSSLSPPRTNNIARTSTGTTTNTNNNKNNATLKQQQQQQQPEQKLSPPKKAATSTTTVAAAMIAAAANRRLEKSATNSPPQVTVQEQRVVEQQQTAHVSSNGSATTRKASAYHQAAQLRKQQLQQQNQTQLSPTTKTASPTRSRNMYHQHHNNTSSLQKPESPIARMQNRHLSPMSSQQQQQYSPSNYQGVVDTTSSLSPRDRYESIQPQQPLVRRQNNDGDYNHQQAQHTSPQMMIQASHGAGQHYHQNINGSMMMMQYSPADEHLRNYTATTSDDYPEMPSLLPEIRDTGPYPMDEHRRLQQDLDYTENQQTLHIHHKNIAVPLHGYNPDEAIPQHRYNPHATPKGTNNNNNTASGEAISPQKASTLYHHNDGNFSIRTMQNSPGTTTSPYAHYPVPRGSTKKSNVTGSSRQKHPYNSNNPNRLQRKQQHNIDDEEKKFSEPLPIYQRQHSGGLQRTSSSSDYETDYSRGGGDMLPQSHRTNTPGGSAHQYNNKATALQYRERALKNEPTFSNMSASQVTPDVAAFFDNSSETKSRSLRDDDTFDYGDRDDDNDDQYVETADDTDSQGSLSYEQRRKKMEKEREARAAAVAAAKAEMDGPFMKHDDVEHYRKVVDTPLGRTAAVVATAATVGCIILGPVGLFLGVAAVGIGVGYMQIPEEQRQNMNSKVTDAMKSAQESAIDASEKLSINCLATYKESGMSEHVPPEMETCCVNLAGLDGTAQQSNGHDDDGSLVHDNETSGLDENGNAINVKSTDKRKPNTPINSNWHRGKTDKVTCLRKGKIVPLAQIHALDPSAQPRAWLDVLANADTSASEKIEASEEILILAKDKHKSRIFVDEGILDCLLWTIGRYYEKQVKGPGSENWTNAELKPEEKALAKLAANCCLTLGKSYCAAIHTEGDLLLMSLYDRGTVPEERQLAQMLMEVPHHTRSTKTDDPTIVTPGKESFTLKQLTLSQAEELASVITSIAAGA